MKTKTLLLLSTFLSINSNKVKKLLYLVTFIYSINITFAQSPISETELFTQIPELNLLKAPIHVQAKLKELQKNKAFKSVRPITLGNLAKIQKNGTLSFTIPGSDKFIFNMTKVDAESESNFKWRGRSPDGLNNAIFISEKGMLFGSFSMNNIHYQVFTTEEGISFLIEENNNLEISCGSNNMRENPNFIIPKNNRRDNCIEAIRVLVLYTQNATSTVANIGQTISLSVEQFNSSIDNSAIGTQQTNKIELAGTQQISFSSSANPETEPNITLATQYIRDNTTVQSLRNQYQADIVVCLVNGVYNQSAIGNAISVPATNSDYCALVVSGFSSLGGSNTFAHELGHLLGGRHQDDTNGPSYSHGYSFTTNPAFPNSPSAVRTLMHTYDPNSSRILQFSNPNVVYQGTTSGTVNTNNVARRIGEISPVVVDFRASTNPSFNGYIQGPGNIGNSGSYQWELIYSCRDIVSREWKYSTDGFNFGSPIGSSDILNYNLNSSNNGLFYLKCTITTSSNETFSVTQYVSVNICSGCRLLTENVELVEKDIRLYPNPSQTQIMIDYSLENTTEVELGVFDIIGRVVFSKSLGTLDSGNHHTEFDVSNLQSGKYTLKLLMGSKLSNKVFVVSK